MRKLLTVTVIFFLGCNGENLIETWQFSIDGENWQSYESFSELDSNYTGHIHFRTTFEVERPEQSFSINTERLSDVSEFYINEEFIGGVGSVDPYEPGSYRHAILLIPADTIIPGENMLRVSLYSDGKFKYHFNPALQLGPTASIFENHFYSELISFVLLGVYFAVGVYHLLLFLKRRKEKYNLFFGLFAAFVSFYWFFNTETRDLVFSNNIVLRTTIEHSVLFLLGPFLIFFLKQFFERQYSTQGILYAGFCSVLILISAVSSMNIKLQVLQIWQISALFIMLYFVYYIIYQAFRGNRDGLYILAGFLLLMAAAVHDVFSALDLIDSPHIARYSFPVFILGIAAVLANRFVKVHNQVEELNRNLELKVEERTKELQVTLEDVARLKHQQDGDYYLTSLLIKPLLENNAKSSHITVELLTRQKKHFHFKNHNAEIGGDISSSHTIELQGKEYIAFVNGDAMGKSLQGASGALVLGVVFKSIITRSHQSTIIQEKSPERWLSDCYRDLQNVFVSFDGFMMMSAIIGLIDSETGLMYFINAEHPYLVLYRQDRARFIDTEIELRKLGIDIMMGKLRIQTFSMQPDDVIISGSDGRDDILLGYEEQTRIINEDENAFLEVVENARGSLEGIEEELLLRGELTDDMGLLRIAFKEDAALHSTAVLPEAFVDLQKEARQLIDQNPEEARTRFEQALQIKNDYETLLEHAKLSYKLKHYDAALASFEKYLQHDPSDMHNIYLAAYSAKLAGHPEKGIDYGVRVRLRGGYIRNLINLGDCYRLTGKIERAKEILAEIRDEDPNHPAAKQLAGFLEKN